MFGVQTRMTATPKRVEKAKDKGAFKSFAHAAASIRKTTRASIKTRKKPGPPGGPIRTKSGKGGGLARRSVLFHTDKTGAVIGFAASKIDQAMEAHEHGKERGDVLFPKRPTVQPALEQNLARFHREWKGAI